jgi:hypothetical protein
VYFAKPDTLIKTIFNKFEPHSSTTMKTVLSIWHTSDKGKTDTLRAFANLLLTTFPSFTAIFPVTGIVPLTGDFRLVVQINGKIIGIESQGDPNTTLQNRLLDLADNFKCDVILCSTRTRGDTVVAVDNLLHTRGFDTIWTSTYQIDGRPQQIIANNLKAKHILDLLQTLGRL